MKRAICAVVVCALLVASCGKPLTISTPAGAKTYPTYGLLNESTDRSKNVCYQFSFGNLVWSIFLAETIIAPIYFVGFSLFNPVRMKRDEHDTCDSMVDA